MGPLTPIEMEENKFDFAFHKNKSKTPIFLGTKQIPTPIRMSQNSLQAGHSTQSLPNISVGSQEQLHHSRVSLSPADIPDIIASESNVWTLYNNGTISWKMGENLDNCIKFDNYNILNL